MSNHSSRASLCYKIWAAVLNILMISVTAILEWFISVFYLGGVELLPSRKAWLLNASLRSGFSLIVATGCCVAQYFVNRSLLGDEVSSEVLKKVSYGSFGVLALILAIRFFLVY